MSVVIKMVVVPKYVQPLKEASIVIATLDLYWTVMELLVMVNITRNIHIIVFIQRNIICMYKMHVFPLS